MKNLFLACAFVSLVSFAEDPKIKIDSADVPSTGYVGELVKDPQFLALDIDLRKVKPESAALTYAQWVSVLDLRIVNTQLEKFVNEAIVADCGLYFQFNDRDANKIVYELLKRLGEKNADVKNVNGFIQAVTGGDKLLTLAYSNYFQKSLLTPTKALEKFIVSVSQAKDLTVKHTTKSVAPEVKSKAAVPGFEPFFSGRYGVSFTDGDGAKQYLVLQTESDLGHLQPIIPGETAVNGVIMQSEEGFFDEKAVFTQGDVAALLRTLYKAWGAPTDDTKKLILGAVAAIYANDDTAKLKRITEK